MRTVDQESPALPSQANPPNRFDRIATVAATTVARGGFFAVCTVLVLGWACTYFVFDNVDTWQLIINTATTIITFLLVALLQNSQHRSDRAIQRKLNALAEGLADLMEAAASRAGTEPGEVEELREAVGLEHREGT